MLRDDSFSIVYTVIVIKLIDNELDYVTLLQ